MAYNIRWRRAVMVSVLCHIFLFAGAGYLSAHLFTTPITQEQYVELELMNEFQAEQSLESAPNHVLASQPALPEPTLTPEKIEQVSTPTPLVANDTPSMVTTGELAVTSTSSNETSSGSAEPANTGSSTSNAGTSGKSGGIIPPGILSKVSPPYPESVRRAGIEGTVILKIQISENGRAGNISISRSSGNEVLDDAAIATIKQWRFVPAKDRSSGQAISCYTTIPIAFRLK